MKQANTSGLPFQNLMEKNKFYVDKSLLIKDILDQDDCGIYLFTRPRRFGKTTNITMLNAFFNVEFRGNTWFDGLKISETHDYDQYKNAFPVINLNMKSLSCSSEQTFVDDLKTMINISFNPFFDVCQKAALTDYERKTLNDLYSGTISMADLKTSVALMCRILKRYYGKDAIVLIDEYDRAVTDSFGTEIQPAIVTILGEFLSSTLKDNDALQMAYITGVMKVAKTGIFSGVNNISVNDVFSTSSDERFGFTESEVKEITEYYGHPESFENLKKWYDGYRFGNAEVYNPYSVMYCVQQGFKTSNYWVRTSADVPLKWIVSRVDADNLAEIANLFNGYTVCRKLRFDLTYDDLKLSRLDDLFSLMVMTGYLNAVPAGDGTYKISIPNKEVGDIIDDLLKDTVRLSNELFTEFNAALLDGNADKMARILQQILIDGSYYNLTDETSYELIILTLMHGILRDYKAESQRESGNGRVDLILSPTRDGVVPIIVELKVADSEDRLDSEVEAGFAKMHDRRYYLGMRGKVVLVSLAFYKKIVRGECRVHEIRVPPSVRDAC